VTLLDVIPVSRALLQPPLVFYLGGAVLVIVIAIIALISMRGKRAGYELKCVSCGRVVMSDWERCLFCGKPVGTQRQAELQFVAGSMAGKTLPLDRDVTTLGTAPGNTVLMVDQGISRKHVGIKRMPGDNGGYELADLGSTNGVYVNGERVSKRLLAAGDIIRFGSTELVFKA
jgi:DNA-directed RNA polymerase subunit N (RpoN/RPB10)